MAISEAAFHEAGHAVMAALSDFHMISSKGGVQLANYGAGTAYIGLSPSKLSAAGHPATASSQKLPDVARSMATVLAAGLAAEKLAAQQYPSITPNPSAAGPDHAQLVAHASAAGISTAVAPYEAAAMAALQNNWHAVWETARMLDRVGTISGGDLAEWVDGYI